MQLLKAFNITSLKLLDLAGPNSMPFHISLYLDP